MSSCCELSPVLAQEPPSRPVPPPRARVAPCRCRPLMFVSSKSARARSGTHTQTNVDIAPCRTQYSQSSTTSNWGLHDGPLENSTVPGQYGLPDVYAAQLEVITKNLIDAQPQAKLLFALTSPYMCAAQNDGCVVNLNNQAAAIMAKYKIPTINLHDAVVEQCGPPPQKACFNATGCFCPHCAGGAGYNFLTDKVIVPAITRLLP